LHLDDFFPSDSSFVAEGGVSVVRRIAIFDYDDQFDEGGLSSKQPNRNWQEERGQISHHNIEIINRKIAAN
jgi:hypothetical protein